MDKQAIETRHFELGSGNGRLGGRYARTPEGISRPVIIAIHGGTYTSAYFDVPGYSLMERAKERGFDIIAVDRPGYGISPPLEDAPDLIRKNAEHLDRVVPSLLDHIGRRDAPVFLIGHSIGGAIVIETASLQPQWNLVGLAVSGVGLKTPPEDAENYARLPVQYFVELPAPMKDAVMFGPAGTYPAGMPQASHVANTTVPRSELTDITGGWQDRLKAMARLVKVPVHYRQGGHEKLWLVDRAMVEGFGKLFTSAGLVDCRLLENAGHCIDFHNDGPGLQTQQLDFAEKLHMART
jgi:pimeloyl-ACP methyl ester carboxylesterase